MCENETNIGNTLVGYASFSLEKIIFKIKINVNIKFHICQTHPSTFIDFRC